MPTGFAARNRGKAPDPLIDERDRERGYVALRRARRARSRSTSLSADAARGLRRSSAPAGAALLQHILGDAAELFLCCDAFPVRPKGRLEVRDGEPVLI